MKVIEQGQRARLEWQMSEVVEIKPEIEHVKTIVLRPASWGGHQPGQHVDVRLTAPDGYQAQRSYSIASAPRQPFLELTVERIEGGEVSEFLVDELRTGDKLELRGPIGGHFVWNGDASRPLWLIGGGSGIVPLMAMLRHRAATERLGWACLISSSRSINRIIYHDELQRLSADDRSLQVVQTLTRSAPVSWDGWRGRIDRKLLAECGFTPDKKPRMFICGPVSFVGTISDLLIDMGHDPGEIRTERFGPSAT